MCVPLRTLVASAQTPKYFWRWGTTTGVQRLLLALHIGIILGEDPLDTGDQTWIGREHSKCYTHCDIIQDCIKFEIVLISPSLCLLKCHTEKNYYRLSSSLFQFQSLPLYVMSLCKNFIVDFFYSF